MTLRVALVAPGPLDSPRGNAVTVARIARGLRGSGLAVDVLDAESPAAAAPEGAALVHAFHAHRAGPTAGALARARGVPLVVTLTGTDVSHDLLEPATRPLVLDVLRAAAVVTVFHESVAAVVRAALPEVAPRLVVVPQSVCFEPGPPESPGPALGGAPCLLFPAGIRPVKRPRFPLAPLDALARARPGLRLWYVGPVLDRDEMRRLQADLATRPWARYGGVVPHQQMPRLLEAADIVLNCSTSEGGMANAVLEALACGRAALVSDIPGNRSLVTDDVTGLLFASEAELAEKAARLADDPALRERLGRAGQALVAARFTPAVERAGYLAVYERALGTGPPP